MNDENAAYLQLKLLADKAKKIIDSKYMRVYICKHMKNIEYLDDVLKAIGSTSKIMSKIARDTSGMPEEKLEKIEETCGEG